MEAIEIGLLEHIYTEIERVTHFYKKTSSLVLRFISSQFRPQLRFKYCHFFALLNHSR